MQEKLENVYVYVCSISQSVVKLQINPQSRIKWPQRMVIVIFAVNNYKHSILIMAMRFVEFSSGVTKLERFLPLNQHV